MKKLLTLLSAVLLSLTAGCAARLPVDAAAAGGEIAAASEEVLTPQAAAAAVFVDLTAQNSVSGAAFEDGVLTITDAGVYRLFGVLDGSIEVDADGAVEIILAGATVTGAPCLKVLSEEPVTVTVAADTVNTLSDGISEPDESGDAVIYSMAPLTMRGDGELIVSGGADNGVRSKADLTVCVGALSVTAADNGLKCEGTLTVAGGSMTIHCGGDGLTAKESRIGEGVVAVLDGLVSIKSDTRGVDADNSVLISGGGVSIVSQDDGIRTVTAALTGGAVSIHCASPEEENAEDDADLEKSEITDNSVDGIHASTVILADCALTVNAADEAIQAELSVTVEGGELELTSGGDGVKSDGTVMISAGRISVNAAGDAIQAAALLTVDGGVLDLVSGGGGGEASGKSGDAFGFGWNQTAAVTESVSAKGLKCDGDIVINGGTIVLNTADDSVHCARLCTVNGGDITICSSDDALHADDMLIINDGTINIADCFEGLEAYAIEVNGGDVVIRAVNDGINANGSEGGMFGFPGGMNQQSADDDFDSVSGAAITYYRQTGGVVDLVVTGTQNNVGDGVDSNGSVYIDGGVLTVSTFGNTQEGGIDYGQGEFVITGGMVMAGGASMMQESISESSTQCSAVLSVDTQPGGTLVAIVDGDGNEIWSYTMTNTFNCLVLSHPGMTEGNTYTVTYGTSSSTLDFTSSAVINMSGGGFGMMGFGGMRF